MWVNHGAGSDFLMTRSEQRLGLEHFAIDISEISEMSSKHFIFVLLLLLLFYALCCYRLCCFMQFYEIDMELDGLTPKSSNVSSKIFFEVANP